MTENKPASRTDRKREETQQKIIQTALLLFNRYGLEAVTMEKIAEEVDIAKGTLYNHFSSKDAIIAGFLQRTFSERQAGRVEAMRALPDTRSRLRLIFNQLVEGVQRNRDIFEAFMVYRMKQVLSFRPEEGDQSGLTGLIHEVIVLGQQGGDLRSDLPEDLLSGLFEYAVIATVKPFYLQPESYNAPEAIERCIDLFLNGAGSVPGE